MVQKGVVLTKRGPRRDRSLFMPQVGAEEK